MEYEFLNKCEIPNHTVGKIILCVLGNQLMLYGKMVPFPELEECSHQHLREERTEWLYAASEVGMVGGLGGLIHAIIEYDEKTKIMGGTQAARKDNILYIHSPSRNFWDIHPEAVQRCVEALGLTVKYQARGFHGEIPDIEEYVRRRNRFDRM